MWILESDADFLQGKRMWLKPGKKYLFGRVKRDGVRFAIDHKTISRKHFVITLDNVRHGDVSRIHARSRISITDENSKAGTHIDGEMLKADTRELTRAEHSIRPGNFNHELIIRWQPCVLTFSITKREMKADALKSKRERLEDLDIKVLADYINEVTTHVVATKRNTAKGLQAIIQGRYIVADSYVDALIYAATPADLGGEENLSLLEQDFDTAWPKETDHLPPPGREPTSRSDESYTPNPARSNVFENFIFVFGDQNQYDNLLPSITLGLGKALLYKVINGETTADELVEYMHNTAGKKGFGDVQKDSDNGGVVMIRWHGDKEYDDWTQTLINEVALKLDQRAIDQAEFLDAILANDAFTLRQTIPFESTVEGRAAPPPTAASFKSIKQTLAGQVQQSSNLRKESGAGIPPALQTRSSQALPFDPPPSSPNGTGATQVYPSSKSEPAPESPSNAPAAANNSTENAPLPPKRSRLRGAPVPKFADFDDGFDADSIPSYNPEDYPGSYPISQSPAPSQPQSYSYSREVSAVPSMNIKDEPPTSTRKRRHSSPTANSPDDDIDDLLPAATAMKRRRLALETETKAKGQPVISSSNRYLPATKPKKKEKEIDVREKVLAQRKLEDEEARKEAEDLAEGLGYENDEKKPAGLAVVVNMELPLREARNGRNALEDRQSERWDPRWNGRKNFKKFRKSRVGETDPGDRDRFRGHQVIVPLIEVKRNTYGFGEKYWDRSVGNDAEEGTRGKKGKKGNGERVSQIRTQSQSQNQSQPRSQGTGKREIEARNLTQTVAESGEDSQNPGAGESDEELESTSPATRQLQREAAAIVEHAINPDAQRRTRLADKTQSQNLPTPTAGTKHPASKTKAGPAKKQKTIPTVTVHGSDSEDSDDLKFKFGRSRKGKAR